MMFSNSPSSLINKEREPILFLGFALVALMIVDAFFGVTTKETLFLRGIEYAAFAFFMIVSLKVSAKDTGPVYLENASRSFHGL